MVIRRVRARSQRGAAAVEFALVVPLLLLLLFGMISTGFMFNDHLSITNAVREGARFGSSTDFRSPTWSADVRDRVKQTYFNDIDRNTPLDLTDAEICVKIVDSTHAAVLGSNQWSGSQCGDVPDLSGLTMTTGSCAVVVWVEKPRTIQLLVAPDLRIKVHAKSVAYYGQKAGACTAS